MSSLILASTSPYRRELLNRLGWPFQAQAPLFDEEAGKLEAPTEARAHAAFLARGKAQSLAGGQRVVIGGDQVISFQGELLGKPLTFAPAVSQLLKMSGQVHELLTAVCVMKGSERQEWVNVTKLTMRSLSQPQIEEYVRRDNPMDAAGSYKFERQGLLLFEKVECEDFTAIQGLPLMKLAQVLIEFGFVPFAEGTK